MEEDLDQRPEAMNLITLYAAMRNAKRADIMNEIAGDNFASFKTKLADAMIAHLDPIRDRMQILLGDITTLDTLLEDGAWRANQVAKPVMDEVYETIGFPRFG